MWGMRNVECEVRNGRRGLEKDTWVKCRSSLLVLQELPFGLAKAILSRAEKAAITK